MKIKMSHDLSAVVQLTNFRLFIKIKALTSSVSFTLVITRKHVLDNKWCVIVFHENNSFDRWYTVLTALQTVASNICDVVQNHDETTNYA